MKKLFFSHTFLDNLIQEGKIGLEGSILTLMTADRPSFELEPAYRILKTAGDPSDPHRLVGRIMYEKDIKSMGAEVYLNSLLYRDVAYDAEAGFIGEKKELLDRLSDTDILAKFLLDNLL
jgi:hypothetical protein